MKKTIRVIAFLILVCVPSFGAIADEKASRPATKKDLVGTWDMVLVRPAPNQKDPTFYPYQRFVFRADSSLKMMTADKPFEKDWLQKFEQAPAVVDYSVTEKGVLTMSWQKQPHVETAVAAYVLKDVPANVAAKLTLAQRKQLPKKGDLTLSFVDQGKIIYQKIFTKVQ